MKLKLFLLAFLIFGSVKAFSQAIAYPVPDIHLCNTEVFDLTVNTAPALANQDPSVFDVGYYETLADANTGMTPIAYPEQFVPWVNEQVIYVRVTSMLDASYDITSFTISWSSVFVYTHDDVIACDFFTLPPQDYGNYYTGPNGTGTMIMTGDIITISMTLYIYAEDNGCSDETSFTITIGSVDTIEETTPLLGCDDNEDGLITLDFTTKIPEINQGQALNVTFHFTAQDAANNTNAIFNPANYVTDAQLPFNIYVRAQDAVTGCYDITIIPVIDGDCTGNFISGTLTYDMDNDGCDENDIPAGNVSVIAIHGATTYQTFTNSDGNYVFENVQDGANVVTITQNTVTLNPSPVAHQVTMPGDGENKDFCLTVPNPVNEVLITLIPVSDARPGFLSTYTLVYQNAGSLPVSGNISLYFDGITMTFSDAFPAMAQAGNSLSLDYSNLMPFETRSVYLSFMIMQPPVVEAGHVLTFAAVMNPTEGDINPDNNVNVLNQVVVNSYDPNDISVREGEYITEAQADGYLHYTIRFQNTGTTDAVNVRLNTTLDENLDWNTLQPMGASHDYSLVRNGNALTFRFNNINLPAESVDEEGSNGYVVYRIKPVADIQLGESMSADAAIYFDFNPPIFTNTVTTTVSAPMGIKESAAELFTVYPNPASGKVTIQLKNTAGADVAIVDVLGKTVIRTKMNTSEVGIDISSLNAGMYFITLTFEGKSTTKKLVVN